MKSAIIGLSSIIAALWGGAYAYAFFPEWMKFPAIATAVIVGFVGFRATVALAQENLLNAQEDK